jgi:glutamate synthase domain-containing protein 1
MPHKYYSRVVKESLGKELGSPDSYGTGIVFVPKADDATEAIKKIFEAQARQCGLNVIGWRSIKTGK